MSVILKSNDTEKENHAGISTIVAIVYTYPQEKRHCTIARMPNLGPKTVLKTEPKVAEKPKDCILRHDLFLFFENAQISRNDTRSRRKGENQSGTSNVFWVTYMRFTTSITSRLSLTLREKSTGPLEPVANDKMLKLAENQIENI